MEQFNDIQKAQRDRILSCYGETEESLRVKNELEKGGEGSRGGKVIGHTRSGKPIYEAQGAYYKESWNKHTEGAHSKKYEDFSKEDHEDASKLLKERHHAIAREFRKQVNEKLGKDTVSSEPQESNTGYEYSSITRNLHPGEVTKIASAARKDKSFSFENYSSYGKDEDDVVAHAYLQHKLVGHKTDNSSNYKGEHILAKLSHSNKTNNADASAHAKAPSIKARRLEQKIKDAKRNKLDTAPLEEKLRSLRSQE